MLAGTLPAPVLAEETVPEYPSSEVEGFNETGENQTETEGSGFSSEEKKNENQETSGQEENPDQISDPVNENKADQGSELNNESEEKKNESEEQLKEESEKKQGESEEKKDSSEEKQENSQEQLKEDSEEKKEETDPKKSEELKAKIPSATYEESISISLGDNNVLLQGYMDMLSGLNQPAPNTRKKLRAATAAGYASLTSEHEKRAYILISDYIRGIVSGENTSTIIEIEILSQFFDGKMEFTKEELGVDSILDSKGKIADEVDPAIIKLLFDVDYDKVFNALRADDPYRFFWMTSGINLYKTFMRSGYDADSNQIIFYDEATVTLNVNSQKSVTI